MQSKRAEQEHYSRSTYIVTLHMEIQFESKLISTVAVMLSSLLACELALVPTTCGSLATQEISIMTLLLGLQGF